MRAFIVEFMGADDGDVIAGRAARASEGGGAPVARGAGSSRRGRSSPGPADPTEGEPA